MKIKILKFLLIPTLGISSIGAIVPISTSCGQKVVPIENIGFEKQAIELFVGETFTLTPSVSPAAANKNVNWAFNQKNEAVQFDTKNTKNKDACVITAKNVGEATVTATSVENKNLKAECVIKVLDFSLSDSHITLGPNGDQHDLSFTISQPESCSYSAANVTWKLGNESIATFDGSGSVTSGSTEGATDITATLETASGSKKIVTCVVDVKHIYLTGLSFRNSVLNFSMNGTTSGTFILDCTPTNATDKTVTWTSSDPTIATVNSGGLVRALRAGTVTITATSKENKNIKATGTVVVSNFNN